MVGIDGPLLACVARLLSEDGRKVFEIALRWMDGEGRD